MSQETRKEKRLKRKADRQARKAAFEKFTQAVQAIVHMELKDGVSYKDKFKIVWPVLKPTLEFLAILKITGEKFDEAVGKIIIVGDNMFGTEITDADAQNFLQQLDGIWNTVEMMLNLTKVFVNDKVDDIIDKVIEIGDWIFE
jgi:hypothetical protein